MAAPIHPTTLMSSLVPAPVLRFPRKSLGVACERSLAVLPADPTGSCSKATHRLRSTHLAVRSTLGNTDLGTRPLQVLEAESGQWWRDSCVQYNLKVGRLGCEQACPLGLTDPTLHGDKSHVSEGQAGLDEEHHVLGSKRNTIQDFLLNLRKVQKWAQTGQSMMPQRTVFSA